MLVSSDNDAANALEVWLAGSTSAGSAASTRRCGRSGSDSTMYGGYETAPPGRATAPIPIRVESQPAFGVGKYTTAADLARLLASSISPPPGRGRCCGTGGPAPRPDISSGCSRWSATPASSTASSRPARAAEGGLADAARHDNGIVAYEGGVFVATVMTWHAAAADVARGPGRAELLCPLCRLVGDRGAHVGVVERAEGPEPLQRVDGLRGELLAAFSLALGDRLGERERLAETDDVIASQTSAAARIAAPSGIDVRGKAVGIAAAVEAFVVVADPARPGLRGRTSATELLRRPRRAPASCARSTSR